MRRIMSVEEGKVQLEVIECDCGYHMGVDATYIEQAQDFVTCCPACGAEIDTLVVLAEDPSEVSEE